MSTFDYRQEISNSFDSLNFYFNPCTREPKEWKEEIYAAALRIANIAGKPIWVCSNGGISSEIICKAFFDQGIDFSVLTIVHAAGTNLRDVRYATRWCRAHGVHQKLFTMDMSAFFTQGVDTYAVHYITDNPFHYLQIKLMEIVEGMGGYAVIPEGEQWYNADLEKKSLTIADLYLRFTSGHASVLDWCKDNALSHEPFFYMSTPELCLSYMRLPLVSFVLNNPETLFRNKNNMYSLQRIVYRSIWTQVRTRYELDTIINCGPLIRDAVKRLREKFASQLHTYHLPVTTFEKQLTSAPAESPKKD
jgi:hypothetical protein